MTLQRTAWTRRRALLALAAGGAADGVRAAAPSLPPSQSLQGELARALAARQPLVVMVSLHGCPWCKLVREHYLAPMHAQEGLPVVQIGMGGTHATRTVAGERTTHGALVRAWGVKLAPTVLFLWPDGREVADRLVGGSPAFYGAYLAPQLAAARLAVA